LRQYLLELARNAVTHAEVIGRYRPWTFMRGPSVVFKKLVEECVSTSPEADEGDFKTLVQVNAGQSVTKAETGTFSHEIEIEEESTRQLEATAGKSPSRGFAIRHRRWSSGRVSMGRDVPGCRPAALADQPSGPGQPTDAARSQLVVKAWPGPPS
jgi:hypothetical protein